MGCVGSCGRLLSSRQLSSQALSQDRNLGVGKGVGEGNTKHWNCRSEGHRLERRWREMKKMAGKTSPEITPGTEKEGQERSRDNQEGREGPERRATRRECILLPRNQ